MFVDPLLFIEPLESVPLRIESALLPEPLLVEPESGLPEPPFIEPEPVGPLVVPSPWLVEPELLPPELEPELDCANATAAAVPMAIADAIARVR